MVDKVLAKIKVLDEKLDRVKKIEQHLDDLVNKEESAVEKIEAEERKIEAALLTIGNFTVKRSHLLELARGAAGAFLGVGLGQALGGSVHLAETLPWLNIFGILFFIFILVGLLIYRNDRDEIRGSGQEPVKFVVKKLVMLYIISLVVQLIGLILFNNFPGWDETLIKALIIGSYSAMSSAVAFTLI